MDALPKTYTAIHFVTDQPIKGPIICEYKVHRMYFLVWRSRDKELHQCRLELKEASGCLAQQFPLKFGTLFLVLLFQARVLLVQVHER